MDKVLNYPGAKWSLAEKIIPYIPDHHSYLEPFFRLRCGVFQQRAKSDRNNK